MFQPDLQKLIKLKGEIHFILGEFLRASRTISLCNLALQYFGIQNCYYVPFELPRKGTEIDTATLEYFFDYFKKTPCFRTVVVSNPFKQFVESYVDDIFPTAHTIGGINFITKQEEGKIIGDNKDGEAFEIAAQAEKINFQECSMLFFGCGGVSSAVAYRVAPYLRKIGLVDINIERQAKLLAILKENFPHLETVSFTRLDKENSIDYSAFDIVYNGTGLGKSSSDPQSLSYTPVCERDIFCSSGTAIDANYTPSESRFLQQFKKRGWMTYNGQGHMIASSAFHLTFMANKHISYEELNTFIRLNPSLLTKPGIPDDLCFLMKNRLL